MHDGSQFDILLGVFAARRLRMREFLAREIADLPERERLVFTLYYYEELETSEIARLLGETSSAVLQLHTSVLNRLKIRLPEVEKLAAELESLVTGPSHLQ